jgi:uncharacterized protein (TIGR04255 family)
VADVNGVPVGVANPLPGRPDGLPSFETPPVDEVVIGLRFLPLLAFSDSTVAEYRVFVGEGFPGIQYQPRLESPIDSLLDLPPAVPLTFGPQPTFGRSWLINTDDSRLIQLQNDAFLYNWRSRGNPYPRFETVYEEFWNRYELLRNLPSVQPAPPRPQQLEITYINWIRNLRTEQFLKPALVSRVQAPPIDEFPHNQQWAGSYFVRDGEGRAIARLVLACTPALRLVPGGDPQQGIQLSLVFRSPLPPNTADDALASFIGLGRNSIVWSFAQLTTEQAHETWGRTQ